MIKMKTISTLITILAFLVNGYSQATSTAISGYIKDSHNEIVSGATVQLISASDSSKIKTVASNENGKFQLNNLRYGAYLLVVTAIGQKKFTSAAITTDSLHSHIALPAIILLPTKTTALAEVVIKAKRPLVVQEIDKTVVNPESMITSAGSNVLEVLGKTPGVTVTSNGVINLNGRTGILVLIDGRSTYMSEQDLAAYLKSLPGAVLDKIELMDNPPARYDAAGNAIINIRLKKNRAGGFTGNIATGYTQSRYAKSNNALNLNYNVKKINLFINTGYSYDKGYDTDMYDRLFFNASHQQTASITLANRQVTKSNAASLNGGLDYSPSANTTFGILVNMNNNSTHGWLNYSSENYTTSLQPDSVGNGSTRSSGKRNNFGSNLNFLHKFGQSGKELSAELNYLHYNGNGNQVLNNFVYGYDGTPLSNSSLLYNLPSNIAIYTAKADYTQPLKQNMKLEAGIKSSIVDNDNIALYYNTTGGSPVIDNHQSNHFLYHENIIAAYINTQAKWSRFGMQLGLRIENTRANGRQLGNDSVKESRFTKDYTQLFPSVFLSYKLDTLGNNSLTLSLTRRINRPNYQSLNPFVFMHDQYSYTAGNPLLGPQYQYRYELRFQHRQFLRMGLSYNRFSNVIFQTTQAAGNIFITQPNNVAKGYMLLLNTGITALPAKWWTINTDILLSYMGLNGVAYSQTLNPRTYVARLNMMHFFQFGKVWSAEATAYYASRDLSGQAFTSARFRAGAAIQKKIWKEKGSIRLGFDDIFHSWVNHNQSVDLKQAQYFQTTEYDSQRIGLAFTYRFGKSHFARKSKNNNNASDEEKGRVD